MKAHKAAINLRRYIIYEQMSNWKKQRMLDREKTKIRDKK